MKIDAKTKNKVVDNGVINFKLLIQTVVEKRKFIFYASLVSTVFAVLFVSLRQKRFESTITFVVTDSNSSSSSSFSGLASLTGINLGGFDSSSGISSELYPEIFSNYEFLESVLESDVSLSKSNRSNTVSEYYSNVEDKKIFSLFNFKSESQDDSVKSDQIFSKQYVKLIQRLQKELTMSIDSKKGTITISVNSPDPNLSFGLVNVVFVKFQEYLIEMKLEKSIVQLKYLENRYDEMKIDYKNSLEILYDFTSNNVGIESSKAGLKLTELRNERDLKFEMFSNISAQLEKQKLLVKQNTPIFTILTDANYPYFRANISGFIILGVFVITGLVLSVTFILFQGDVNNFFKTFK